MTASTAPGSTARSTASRTAPRGGSGGLRRLQTGLVRNYALGIALGTVLLLVYIATRVTF